MHGCHAGNAAIAAQQCRRHILHRRAVEDGEIFPVGQIIEDLHRVVEDGGAVLIGLDCVDIRQCRHSGRLDLFHHEGGDIVGHQIDLRGIGNILKQADDLALRGVAVIEHRGDDRCIAAAVLNALDVFNDPLGGGVHDTGKDLCLSVAGIGCNADGTVPLRLGQGHCLTQRATGEHAVDAVVQKILDERPVTGLIHSFVCQHRCQNRHGDAAVLLFQNHNFILL